MYIHIYICVYILSHYLVYIYIYVYTSPLTISYSRVHALAPNSPPYLFLFFNFPHLSVGLNICLSVCLFVCLSIYLSFLPVCLSGPVCLCLSVNLSLYPSVHFCPCSARKLKLHETLSTNSALASRLLLACSLALALLLSCSLALSLSRARHFLSLVHATFSPAAL